MLLKFLILMVIIYIKSIFSSAETAFSYLRKAKINQISKSRRANNKIKRIKELIDNKAKLFGTTKVGITLAELFASAFAAEAFVNNMTKQLLQYNINITNGYIISTVIVTIVLSYLISFLPCLRFAHLRKAQILIKNCFLFIFLL